MQTTLLKELCDSYGSSAGKHPPHLHSSTEKQQHNTRNTEEQGASYSQAC